MTQENYWTLDILRKRSHIQLENPAVSIAIKVLACSHVELMKAGICFSFFSTLDYYNITTEYWFRMIAKHTSIHSSFLWLLLHTLEGQRISDIKYKSPANKLACEVPSNFDLAHGKISSIFKWIRKCFNVFCYEIFLGPKIVCTELK